MAIRLRAQRYKGARLRDLSVEQERKLVLVILVPYGRAIAHQIKGTPGITGLSHPSVHSGDAVWHLDVGSSHPGGEEAPKGLAVRQ